MWTKKENKSWLKMRGLPTLGTASEIPLRVSGYMNNPGGPPPTLPSRNSYVPLIFDVLSSLKAMVSRIMASNVSDDSIADVDMHIKIFLQCFHRFNITLKKNTHRSKTQVANFLQFCKPHKHTSHSSTIWPCSKPLRRRGSRRKGYTAYETILVWVPQEFAIKHDEQIAKNNGSWSNKKQ
jgi:hypothetical protein